MDAGSALLAKNVLRSTDQALMLEQSKITICKKKPKKNIFKKINNCLKCSCWRWSSGGPVGSADMGEREAKK